MKKYTKFLIPFLIIILFLFLRFYNIKDSFFFFNDMGRDMSVLQTWNISGKPPLLGPQTSALPFNQSAIYFYLLYPGYLISQANPVSSLYTLAFVYIITLIFGIYFLHKHKNLVNTILLSFYLIAIHPQYITQARFVWNPSFLTPFLIFSIISFYLLQNKYSFTKLIIFSFSIATAVSISYSAAPLLIIFALYWLLFSRKKFIAYAMSIFASFTIINLPTIIFELRHQFLLTNSLFTKQSPVQAGLSFSTRFNNLSQFIFFTNNQILDKILFVSIFLLCLFQLFKNRHQVKNLKFITSFLYLGLTLLFFITPVSIQAHYIFAFTSLIFIIISTLPLIFKIALLLMFSSIYFQPTRLNGYFKPAYRTTMQMEQCFTNYCQNHKEATFVSVQSSFHPFHNGPEHRFLLRKSGCNVKEIETENGTAKYMSVILDNGTFDEKTNYYELELFGKYKDIETFDCLPNFKIKVLEKI